MVRLKRVVELQQSFEPTYYCDIYMPASMLLQCTAVTPQPAKQREWVQGHFFMPGLCVAKVKQVGEVCD